MLRSRYAIEVADAGVVFSAIAPELESAIAGSRSSLRVSRTEEALLVQIESDDIASLRAATNSWLRLIMVVTEIDAVIAEELNPKPYKCDKRLKKQIPKETSK